MTANKHIKQHEWQDGLFECCDGGHCLTGCCCPCILVNKTYELLDKEHEYDRLENGRKREPGGCGLMGCAWCGLNLCGPWSWIIGCVQRGKIRTRHHISGGGCGDFWTNLCCPCCAVIQQYKEVEMRRDDRLNSKQGYRAQEPMRVPRQ